MISFGQKIKKLRTEAGFSQAYMAEHIGVSVQSISNWECDNTMPDISQIVPLAGILSVSTDFLLGAGMNEDEDKKKLNEKVDYVWATYSVKTSENNADILVSELYFDYLRKYPMDYDVKFKCALALHDYYKVVVFRKKFDEDKKRLEKVYEQSDRLLTSICDNSSDIGLIINALKIRVEHLLMKGKYAKAELIAMKLPKYNGIKSEVISKIHSAKGDDNEANNMMLQACKSKCLNYIFSLYEMVKNNEDAINYLKHAEILSAQAVKNYMDITELKVNDYLNMPYGYLITAYTMQSNKYLQMNDLNSAYEALEKATDVACEMYKWVKAHTNDELIIEDYRYFAAHTPHWCSSFSGLFDSEDNAFTNDERFKKCEEKIDEFLKIVNLSS